MIVKKLHLPILIYLFSIFVYSCQNDFKNQLISSTGKSTSKNAIQARKLLDAGDQFYASQKFDSAYHNYNRSKILYELEKDSASLAYTLIQMATSQQTYGD